MTNNMRSHPEDRQNAPVRFVPSASIPPATPRRPLRLRQTPPQRPPRTFLTGDLGAIVNLSIDGFKLAANTPPPRRTVLHSGKFAVADRRE